MQTFFFFLYFINTRILATLVRCKRLIPIDSRLCKHGCVTIPVFSDGQETDSAGQLPFANQQEIIEYLYCCCVKIWDTLKREPDKNDLSSLLSDVFISNFTVMWLEVRFNNFWKRLLGLQLQAVSYWTEIFLKIKIRSAAWGNFPLCYL